MFLSSLLSYTISDKYRAVESELNELELRCETCQRDFDSISSTIRREMRRFEATRIEDFKKMIVRYLETLMAGQRKIVAEIAASVDAMQNNLLSNEEYTTLADLFVTTATTTATAAKTMAPVKAAMAAPSISTAPDVGTPTMTRRKTAMSTDADGSS